MKRREFLKLSAGVAAVAALSPPARAGQCEGNPHRLSEERRAGDRAAAGGAGEAVCSAGHRREVVRVLFGAAAAGGDQRRQRRLWRRWRHAAHLRAIRRCRDRLRRGAAGHQRTGHSGARGFSHSDYRGSEGQADRFYQGIECAQRRRSNAGKSRAEPCRYHAGVPDAAGCRSGVRKRQHRRLGDLGSLFRDR